MKKFYESPIVELTVFDVEDVITTSAVLPVTEINTLTEDVSAVVTAINAGDYTGVVDSASTYGAYNW